MQHSALAAWCLVSIMLTKVLPASTYVCFLPLRWLGLVLSRVLLNWFFLRLCIFCLLLLVTLVSVLVIDPVAVAIRFRTAYFLPCAVCMRTLYLFAPSCPGRTVLISVSNHHSTTAPQHRSSCRGSYCLAFSRLAAAFCRLFLWYLPFLFHYLLSLTPPSFLSLFFFCLLFSSPLFVLSPVSFCTRKNQRPRSRGNRVLERPPLFGHAQ